MYRLPPHAPTALTTLLVCCAALFGASKAAAEPSTHSASPVAAPLYVEDPAGPIKLGGPPNSLVSSASEGFTSGEGWGSVLVGLDGRKSSEILWNTRRGLFRLSGYHAPPGPGLVTGQTERFGVIDAPRRLVRFYSGSDSLYKPTMTLKTGRQPVAVVETLGDAAILNRGSHDLWVYLQKREAGAEGQMEPVVKVPVGGDPTDAVGGFNLEFGPVFVADGAAGTVAELGTLKEGTYRLRHTIPVGDDPVDLAYGQFIPGGEHEVAVADRGSNSVSILAGGPENATGPANYASVGTYPAGDEPVAVRAVDIDNNGSIDLAVVDAGSDRLTILLNDGHGHFHRAGSFKTGPDPVAVSPIDTWDATFGPDLAVADRSSKTLTIFLRHYSASCRGREARPINGTDGDDTLYSGSGVAMMRGRAGDDHMFSRHPGNCFYGGAGDDFISGKSGGDLIDGGPGNDHLHGGTRIWSRHPTADTIIGGPGRDVIEAGWADDTIRAVDGEKDIVDCGEGVDTAYVDPIDVVHNCEHVHVVRSRRLHSSGSP
jgi:RTX calcium-binding nonapeptide repeat (4 copies)